MTFAERIRAARLERGLSASATARRLDVANATYLAWEAGTSLPTLPRLGALCDLLGLDVVTMVRCVVAA